MRRVRWRSIAAAAALLCGVIGWWSTPTGAQGGSGTTTFTTSTTRHTTVVACPPGFAHEEISVSTTQSLGPGTIFIGENQSETFFVAAGTTNFNTNTHTETFVCALAAAPIPTLSTWALMALVALMVAGGLLALRRRPA